MAERGSGWSMAVNRLSHSHEHVDIRFRGSQREILQGILSPFSGARETARHDP